MLYCYLGPEMLAVLERWLPYTVTILDRFHCTIMVYRLTPYIREYFTREYFNTTVPSNREFKNAKNAKIANPRNINPAKIKAHTVACTVCRVYTNTQRVSRNASAAMQKAGRRKTLSFIIR